jgi:hypothetical protein
VRRYKPLTAAALWSRSCIVIVRFACAECR